MALLCYMVQITDTIPGSDTLRTKYSYDNLGRKRSVTHPTGITEFYAYNTNGYLDSISAGGIVRWEINSMNARQQITSGKYANNLNATFGFDEYGYPTSIVTRTTQDTIQNFTYHFTQTTGNLEWRKNNKHSNLPEVFEYDNLDRLTNVQIDTTILHMTYDGSTGGISSKSDAGTFNYDDKPYSISSIDPSTGIVPADTQQTAYTSFESISSIIEKNYTASFLYSSDNERVKMVIQQNGNPILSRWYTENGYIKEIDGSINRDYTFIGGDAYSAPVVAITQDGTTTYYDLLRDNLGSITHVINCSTNALVDEYSYDVWGRMRNPVTRVNYEPGTEPVLFVAGRGYTGHEHLPWFNLINMNGRVYDPLIAGFLSPDNNVQAPDFTQNFNRYVYCLNNPLSYSDESGEFWNLIIGGLIGGTFNWITHGCQFNAKGLKYFGVGALAGALGAGIGTGVSSALAAATVPAGSLSSVGSAFTAGFVGTATTSATGFAAGFVSGAAGGLSSGCTYSRRKCFIPRLGLCLERSNNGRYCRRYFWWY